MKRYWRKKSLRFLAMGMLVASVFASSELSTSAAAKAQFADVQPSHYAYEAVEWAKAQQIVSGYVDQNGQATGYFGPSDTVTEAQFVKMLATYLQIEDTAGDLPKYNGAASWSDTYYDALARYSVPLNGYFDQKLRNTAVKRGVVAQTIGYTAGEEAELPKAIRFLMEEGISTGQNPQYEGKDVLRYFGTDNALTRAQVVTFLHRMQKVHMTTVTQEKALETLVAKANVGLAHVDESLKTGLLYSETKNPLVMMTMHTKEPILLELLPSYAPNTVNNFIALIQADYYNGVTFHRVIPGFMIQGGDPTASGTGGPNYAIEGEFVANGHLNLLAHTRGVLSMARTNDPNSAGSQFFIMTEDAEHLNGEYAAFGYVVDGMQTVDTIVQAARDAADKPLVSEVIDKVEVETFGTNYPEPIKIK